MNYNIELNEGQLNRLLTATRELSDKFLDMHQQAARMGHKNDSLLEQYKEYDNLHHLLKQRL